MKILPRRHFLKGVTAAGTAMGFAPFLSALADASSGRPNILLIVADDMGFSDIGCYGGEIETPNLDRMATQGLRFTQFYNNAKCEPTRSSLLTGMYHVERRPETDLAEAMKIAGYDTYMVGKWHQPGTPVQQGFDRYFGFLSGMVNFWTGAQYSRKQKPNNWWDDGKPFQVPTEGFYTTDAFTDKAMTYLDDAARSEKPFFMYIAHNAPHYPLHAPQAEIDKYRGRYMKGWDRLRAERYARQIEMGLLDPDIAKLSARPDDVPAWDTLSEKDKKKEDLRFATYAAMVDRLDQNIGRLMAHLKKKGLDENTLVIFMSDNGGCPFPRTRNEEIPPGGPDSYWTLIPAWANVNNTPFRYYKQNQYEGGISTPFIARWPAVITKGGGMVREWAHLVDLMPTFMDLAGTPPDEKFAYLRGKSFKPLLYGQSWTPREEHWFAFNTKHAYREGDWKICRNGDEPWELFNLAEDRSETRNLIEQHPDIAHRLIEKWETLTRDMEHK